MMSDPLIVTVQIAEPEFSHFTALRRKHFPPDRNYIRAHITMFHKLPGDALAEICNVLSTVASQTPIGSIRVTEVRFLGQGTAFGLENQGLQDMRRRLVARFQPWLAPQDQQPWKPHITVQNKVEKAAAYALFNELASSFEPFYLETPGLALWHYRGGPWEHISNFAFPRD